MGFLCLDETQLISLIIFFQNDFCWVWTVKPEHFWEFFLSVAFHSFRVLATTADCWFWSWEFQGPTMPVLPKERRCLERRFLEIRPS